MALDLNNLEKKLDDALSKETPGSLQEFLGPSITPEERASRELAEELGFEIYPVGDPDGTRYYVKCTSPGVLVATDQEWKLWALCVRQRVELNKSKYL